VTETPNSPREVQRDELPELWKAAYVRDRSGDVVYADPAPERRAARVLAAFILTGLGFLALPGTLLGVWNLISIAAQRTSTAANTAWIQAHGQAQLFGWVGTFMLGISLYVLPKFQGRMPKRFGTAWAVWGLWTLGVGWRWWVGVSSRFWRVGLIISGALQLAALLLATYAVAFARSGSSRAVRARRKPADLGSWMGIIGFVALGVALVVNLQIAIRVARSASLPVYPLAPDRAFLLVALWGFAVPMAWGYSTRFVTVFLSLEKPAYRAAAWLAPGVVTLVVLALAWQFLLADLLALVLTLGAIEALRIFHPSVRPPKTTGAYRRYPEFVRASYGWLVAGAVLGLLADLLPAQTGLGGASRHAVTVGFLATLIFAIGPRILPSFMNGRELYSSALMAASLWVLNLGCLLRVSSEAVAYSTGGTAWQLLPVSALLELTAVVIFVVNLALTVSQPMPAWFDPEDVSARLPLYWYVTSFPKTRQLLARAGVRTLERVRDVPRSLTLAETAAADGVEVDALLGELRAFFGQRQPRRTGRPANPCSSTAGKTHP